MTGIIDYGAGNLHSVKNALDKLGESAVITRDEKTLIECDRIILPGVGAFGDAMSSIKERGLLPVIKYLASKKPFLGICLGMQLLFEKSYEFGEHEGLCLIPGTVKKMEFSGLKVPHMGWNSLKFENSCPLLNSITENTYVYFVHSYKAVCDKQYINAYAEYGGVVPALVSYNNIFGAQFHPEKSGTAGLSILNEFIKIKGVEK
ncbi:MAG: imidazole glycerol phosphate synthase subunit HisH [Clostridiales bacterium]|nr:MAG: imidazole glycerol phosphate synthase subunit HisH [Clostridiales bacterium]